MSNMLNFPEKIGQCIVSLRKKRNLSQKDVYLGVFSKSKYSKIESGKLKFLTLEDVSIICIKMCVSLDDLTAELHRLSFNELSYVVEINKFFVEINFLGLIEYKKNNAALFLNNPLLEKFVESKHCLISYDYLKAKSIASFVKIVKSQFYTITELLLIEVFLLASLYSNRKDMKKILAMKDDIDTFYDIIKMYNGSVPAIINQLLISASAMYLHLEEYETALKILEEAEKRCLEKGTHILLIDLYLTKIFLFSSTNDNAQFVRSMGKYVDYCDFFKIKEKTYYNSSKCHEYTQYTNYKDPNYDEMEYILSCLVDEDDD